MAVQVRPQDQEALRPVATPVESFTKVGPLNYDTSWGEFAKGLGSISQDLGSLQAQRQGEEDKQAAAQAEADFHTRNGQGFAEGVRTGAIPAFVSKAYMEAYKGTEGKVAGMQLAQEFATAYDQLDKEQLVSDPEGFKKFYAGFLKDKLPKDADPRVLQGMLPILHQSVATLQAKSIQDGSEIVKKRTVDAASASASQTVDAARQQALVDGKEPNYGAAIKVILDDRERLRTAGQQTDTLDKTYVDTVTSQAIAIKDPKLLDAFFKTTVPGTTHTFGETPYGREQWQQTRDKIASIQHQEQARAYTEKQRADKEALDRLTMRMIEATNADPNAPLPEELVSAGERIDGKFRVDALGWRKTLMESRGQSDPEQLLDVNRRLIEGQNPAEVLRDALTKGVFRDPKDLTAAYTFANAVNANKPAMDKIRQSSLYNQYVDAIKVRTTNENDLNRLGIGNVGMSDVGFKLRQQLDEGILRWKMDPKNKDADDVSENRAINDLGQQLLARIQPEAFGTPTVASPGAPADQPGAATGQRATGTGKVGPIGPTQPGGSATPAPGESNPARPAPGFETPPGMPPVPGQPRAQAPGGATVQPASVQLPTAEEALNWYASLDDGERSQISATAKAAGLTASVMAQRMMAAGFRQQQPGGQGPGNPTPAPAAVPVDQAGLRSRMTSAMEQVIEGRDVSPETMNTVSGRFAQAVSAARETGGDTGSYTLATIKDDPSAAHILDFVAGPESRGNYNAYYGHANSKEDLSGKSLAEIRSWMHSRGTTSSATGRYQFMEGTLFGKNGKAGLVQRLGLSMTEKFTPELQDKLAVQLLNDRGYLDWKRGRLSDEAFSRNLAMEWASLPDPKTGQSYYARDGVNKSLVTGKQVLNTLDGARQAGSAPVQQTAALEGVKDISNLSTYKRAGEKMPEVKSLILHHTATEGSPEDVVKLLNKRGLGVQYVMDRDGTVYQTLPDGSRGAHIRDSASHGLSNDNTVGIEIIAKNDEDVTPAQVESAKRFYAQLQTKYPGIQVFGHGEVNAHKEHTEGQKALAAIRGGATPAAGNTKVASAEPTPMSKRTLAGYSGKD